MESKNTTTSVSEVFTLKRLISLVITCCFSVILNASYYSFSKFGMTITIIVSVIIFYEFINIIIYYIYSINKRRNNK